MTMWRGDILAFFRCRCFFFLVVLLGTRRQGSMAGTAVYRGGGVTMKLAAIMGSCVLLLLVAGCGVDGKASGEAHPHQGKVKVRLGKARTERWVGCV